MLERPYFNQEPTVGPLDDEIMFYHAVREYAYMESFWRFRGDHALADRFADFRGELERVLHRDAYNYQLSLLEA